MVHILPSIYPNELFYSWISRYQSISGNSSRNTTIQLFNLYNYRPNINYPCSLDYFCTLIPEKLNIDSEKLIENHTFMKLFKPFIYEKDYEELVLSIKNEKNDKRKLLILEGDNKRTLYYCESCFNESSTKYGEYYIDAIHQIPGNQLCHTHKEILKKFEIPGNTSAYEYLDINNFKLDNSKDEINEITITAEQVNLSEDIYCLYNSTLEKCSLEQTNEKYDVILQKKGYKIKEGITNRRKLIRDFKEFYSENFLLSLDASIDEKYNRNWLNSIGTKIFNSIDPIKNLLFIRFMFGSFSDFLLFDYVGEQIKIDENLKNILLYSKMTYITHNISDRFTILVKNAERLGILNEFYEIRKIFNNDSIELYKQKIVEYISKKDKFKKTQIKDRFNIEYSVLEIVDKKWLDNVLSNINIEESNRINRSDDCRKVDIDKDYILCAKVIEAVKEIKGEVPLRRVTKTYISKRISYSLDVIYGNEKSYSMTKQVINDSVENYEDFYKRKIDYIVKGTIARGEEVTYTGIIKKIHLTQNVQQFREYIREIVAGYTS